MNAHTCAQITIHTDAGVLTLPAPCSLDTALHHILSRTGASHAQVATAVNGEFVARSLRAQHWLADGDTVLCFAPITGG